MNTKDLDSNNPGLDNDWHGNNAAFTCPACKRVFIVSAIIDRGSRKCPKCEKSEGFCSGGPDKGSARIEWGE